ncbi:MAG: hypothetical protein LBT55_01840 [Clostridiaceae bacterium]|jgi:hypothetical protein|nr:hypothetical protein [Clostridiaceae bacterium]
MISKSKKAVLAVLCVLVIALGVVLFAACNGLKWEGVGGGSPNSPTESQYGFVVKQGGYLYFINGYAGDVVENDFGSQEKGAIVRVELDEKGNVKANTYKRVVPVVVYSTDKNTGFAVFGGYIYYAAPNTEKDKAGAPSTTDINIMRSKIDGSSPEVLLTLTSRSYPYAFYSGAIVWHDSTSTSLYYADLNSGDKKKVSSTVKVIAERVVEARFVYGKTYSPGQDEKLSDFIYIAQSRPSEESAFWYDYKAVKFDGSKSYTLINNLTYLPEGATDSKPYPELTYQIKSVNHLYDEAAATLTLYYTKSVFFNQTTAARGVFYANIAYEGGKPVFKKDTELKLAEDSATTTFDPVSYADGVLINVNSNLFLIKGYADGTPNPNSFEKTDAIIDGTPTVMYVLENDLYYTSASTIYRLSLLDKTAVPKPITTKVVASTTWITYDRIGTKLYYFNTGDYSYVYVFDLSDPDGNRDEAVQLIGYRNAADQTAYDEAHADD